MIFTQYYLDCLSQASYLVADEATGQAVVVDPRRDVAEYLADARARGLHVVGVINTHFHADFLAGHLELATATGAWIGYGRRAQAEYPVRHLADGERISLGDVTLQIMETPGHTPESISVLVFEHAGDAVPYGVLTGDALFIGDVGRPDLLASIGHTADELGRMLHTSIGRLLALPDEVRVFPAHGAGSACGKNLSTERWSTIGDQRSDNYACAPMSEDEFVALVTAGQPAAPDYFVFDAVLNRKVHDVFDPSRHAQPLDLSEVLRPAAGRRGRGRRPRPAGVRRRPPRGRPERAGRRPVRRDRGQRRAAGAADRRGRPAGPRGGGRRPARPDRLRPRGGLPARARRRVPRRPRARPPGQPADRPGAGDGTAGPRAPFVVDVRNPGEVRLGTIPGAVPVPLAQLPGRLAEIPRDRPVVAYCAGGYRSSVAASLLRRAGLDDVSDLLGGYGAWLSLAQPVG